MHYVQLNLTTTPEQQQFLKDNYEKKSIGEMAKELNLSHNKTYNNMKLLGLVKHRKPECKIIDGYFNVDQFAKHYAY